MASSSFLFWQIPASVVHSSPDQFLTVLDRSSVSGSSFGRRNRISIVTPILRKNCDWERSVKARAQLRYPLISPEDHWGVWAALFATGAFGLWSEKTKIGSMVSAALVSTLVGLGASNLGIIPYEAPAYSIFLEFLLPLAVTLLLFRANLHRVIQSTGTLFFAFLLGSETRK